MKLVKETLFEFERGVNPKAALGIGRVAKIQKLFRDADIPDKYYTITPTEVIFEDTLDLSFTKIAELPNNLYIGKNLWIRNTAITELPRGLKIQGNLFIGNAQITEIPDDLEVEMEIYVTNTNQKLIGFIYKTPLDYKLRVLNH